MLPRPHYIIIPPTVHEPSGSGLTSAPDGGADPSVSDVALADDAAVGGASRCAVEPGLSSSWIFRHSAPPSERTGHPTISPTFGECQKSAQRGCEREAERGVARRLRAQHGRTWEMGEEGWGRGRANED